MPSIFFLYKYNFDSCLILYVCFKYNLQDANREMSERGLEVGGQSFPRLGNNANTRAELPNFKIIIYSKIIKICINI